MGGKPWARLGGESYIGYKHWLGLCWVGLCWLGVAGLCSGLVWASRSCAGIGFAGGWGRGWAGLGWAVFGFEASWSWALAHVCTNNPKSLTWSYLTLLLCMRCSSPWLHWAGLGSTWLGWIWVGLCWAKLCCARLATKTQVSDGDWRPNRRRTSEQRTPESLRGRPVVAPPFGFARHVVAPWALRGRSVVVGIVFIQICEKSRFGWVLSPSSSLVLSLSG